MFSEYLRFLIPEFDDNILIVFVYIQRQYKCAMSS